MIPRPPFIRNHVSLASRLIVIWTAQLYATAFCLYATDASFSPSPARHSFVPMCSLASHLNVVWSQDFPDILYATALVCMQQLFLVIDLINVNDLNE